MKLSDLTDPRAIVRAIDEFDSLGRNEFLKRYGFGPARSYFVRRAEQLYDSKAIAGAAVGYPSVAAVMQAHACEVSTGKAAILVPCVA